MKRFGRLIWKVPGVLLLLMSLRVTPPANDADAPGEHIQLPAPSPKAQLSVGEALRQRRSIRSWTRSPLTVEEVSQLLWAAQGITNPEGDRAAPSAGALFPLELYLVATKVTGLEAGVYHYLVERHRLQRLAAGDFRSPLTAASWGQDWMSRAPAALVVTSVVARTAKKYGSRARQYVHMEVGAVAENVYLQATAIGLGTTFVGAFDDRAVARLLGLEKGEQPSAILPVGRRRR